jgi:hypothetical protein
LIRTSLFFVFIFKKSIKEHGKFPAIARNRVARFSLLLMIERVLTVFRDIESPKNRLPPSCARRQYALFIRRISFEILLNKNRFSLMKNSASSLVFQPMLLPFGSYSPRTLRPCLLMPLGVLYLRYIRPPRSDGVSLLCSPNYNEWAYDRVKGGRQANKIGKAK